MDDEDRQDAVSRRQVLQASGLALAALHVGGTTTTATAACPPAPVANMRPPATAAGYVLQRLAERNVRHLFTVPAATSDLLLKAAQGGPVSLVVTSSDLEAGYAADGYARMRGLAAVSVSYGPGTLSLINAIAGAFLEHSPVVVISGGPRASELEAQRTLGVRFSHSTGHDSLDLDMLRPITVFAERITSRASVAAKVDEAILAAITHQRPVYIEIAKGLWDLDVPRPTSPLAVPVVSELERQAASQIARTIKSRIEAARRPVVLVGVEVQRHGLSGALAEWIRRAGLPWASTLVGKTAIPEQTPGFIGVFDGERSPNASHSAVRAADQLIALGTVFSSDYLSLVHSSIDRMVVARAGSVRIGRGAPAAVGLPALVGALAAQSLQPRPEWLTASRRRDPAARPQRPDPADSGLTHDQMFAALRSFLAREQARGQRFVAVADTNLSTHPAADLDLTGANAFVCGAAWKSIGHSLGAALGIAFADESRRALVLCGDGGFQTIAQTMSTLARYRRRPLVIVIDNAFYAVEQLVVDRVSYYEEGCAAVPFLLLNRWDYAAMARAMGVRFAVQVATEAELASALERALAADGPALIAVRVRQRDLPAELRPA